MAEYNQDAAIDDMYEKYDNPNLNLPNHVLAEHPCLAFPEEDRDKKGLASRLLSDN